MRKLTVVIPTYNRVNYLKKAIEGVLNQTFSNFKLVILDNNSTDNTGKVVNFFKDKRIHYIKNTRNIGMISNLNKAIDICETEYLSIPHDDDIMKKNFLEQEIKILENRANVSLVASNEEVINGDGKVKIDRRIPLFEDKIFDRKEYIETTLLTEFFLPFPTAMYRTNVLKENNIRFDGEDGIEIDNYIWFKLNLLPFKFYWLSEPLYKYRFHANRTSKTVLEKGLDFDIKMMYKIKEFLIDKNLEYLLSDASNYFYDTMVGHLIEKTYSGSISRKEFVNCIKRVKSACGGSEKRNNIKLEVKRMLAMVSPKLLRMILKLKRRS